MSGDDTESAIAGNQSAIIGTLENAVILGRDEGSILSYNTLSIQKCTDMTVIWAQAKMPVDMLNRTEWNAKFPGVQFDEVEDEEIAVAYSAHLGAEDLDLGVEGFGRGIGCATSDMQQN